MVMMTMILMMVMMRTVTDLYDLCHQRQMNCKMSAFVILTVATFHYVREFICFCIYTVYGMSLTVPTFHHGLDFLSMFKTMIL